MNEIFGKVYVLKLVAAEQQLRVAIRLPIIKETTEFGDIQITNESGSKK